MMGIELKAFLAGLILALGIAAPLPDVLGGMTLGLGCSYAAMLFTPPTERLQVPATLFAGLVMCIVAAVAHPHLPFGLETWPLQLVMAAAGAASRWAGGALVAFGKGAAERAGKLPGEFKLPGGDK